MGLCSPILGQPLAHMSLMALSGTGAGGREWRQHPALATAKSASTRSIHYEDFAGVSAKIDRLNVAGAEDELKVISRQLTRRGSPSGRSRSPVVSSPKSRSAGMPQNRQSRASVAPSRVRSL